MIVIKLGGADGIDPQPLIDELAAVDEPWVLVHGGNAEMTTLQERLGTPARFVESPGGQVSRWTDGDAIAAMQMSYRGRINNDLVVRFQNAGCNAVGLSGVDGGLLRAERKDAIKVVEDGATRILRGGRTGRVTDVNTHLLTTLLDAGYRPVVTVPALSTDGHAVNVDGDRAAAAIAAALGARALVNLSRVPGLLADPEDASTLIPLLSVTDLDSDAHARGRFKMKLLSAREALDGGVPQVVLATSNTEAPIASALAGHGTVVR